MGGGDLNLKKSWHPQTLHNVEKVWKAEQKHAAEQRKIEQLKREIDEERAREEIQTHAVSTGVLRKKSERLDWLYAAPGVSADREEYLLGKPVENKLIEDEKTEDNSLPGANFTASNVNNPNDVAAKIREDPLFIMKKQEDSKKKELVQNPIKMKKLRELLHATMNKDKKSKKHKKKKSKDHENKHRSDDVRRNRDDNRYNSRNDSGKHASRSSPPRHREDRARHHSFTRRSRSRSPRNDTHERYRRKPHSKNSRSPSPGNNSDQRFRRTRSRSPGNKIKEYRKSPRRDFDRNSNDRYKNKERAAPQKKLSMEEMEKLREEMMGNAKWREEQRRERVQKYKEENEAEKQKKDQVDASFLRSMRVDSYSSSSTSSVQDRIRRNIYSVQRTNAKMDKFLSR